MKLLRLCETVLSEPLRRAKTRLGVIPHVSSPVRKTAGHSVERLPEPVTRLRRSEGMSSTGAILSEFPARRKIPSHADYYRKLDTDPAFAAQMSEQQARGGQWP